MKSICALKGKVCIVEKEIPKIKDNFILVRTSYTAISPGTEITMTKNSGNEYVNLGYSGSGEVVEVGAGVEYIKIGDRVACYGAPHVSHSEYLLVPKTLCVKLPDSVGLREASLVGLGAIAIHALRQAHLQFGEIAVVSGLGIFGQLIGQIANASVLQVVPLNNTEKRAELFERITGIKTFINEVEMESHIDKISCGRGADAVFLCAGRSAGYQTNKSLEWLRLRGKSIIVGDIEPHYDRGLMFDKEIQIMISKAGGPGRYDKVYEFQAIDYPYGYVRWTEGRNMEEFIRLVGERKITVDEYIKDSIKIDEAESAWADLESGNHAGLTKIISYI
ncbi:zinc-dependent alcohol dehydrogenase [Anaerocolumna sp.]|uniref:zinc-dependent alcohol dehydrogenase n=1 Tax=Anaerocolumna sp. TaxID=2041569 RepID=UPI0028A6FF77|nr:zinc-binding alcohol dehydrogenase [Anaerocolumna sp.]